VVRDAPKNGKAYTRKDGDWTPAEVGSKFPTLAGNGGKVLAVTAGEGDVEWVAPAAGGSGGIEEAPTDGVLYVRKNGKWINSDGIEDLRPRHRFWGIQALNNYSGGANGAQFAEIQFRAAIGVEETHTGGAGGSQNAISGSGPDAFDGNLSSYIRLARQDQGNPCRVWYDFGVGAAKPVSEVCIKNTTTEHVGGFNIIWSDDGVNWSTIANLQAANTNDPQTFVIYTTPKVPKVPVGGTAGQALVKTNNNNFDTQWFGPVIEEAPKTGFGYGRKDGKWRLLTELEVGAEPPAHRYWTIQALSAGYNSSIGIAELQWRSVAGIAELPTGGTATGSAVFQGSPAAAYDGNVDGWAVRYRGDDGDGSRRVGYDFGSPKAVTELWIKAATNVVEPIKDFAVLWSDNGTAWTELGRFTGANTTAGQTFAVYTPPWQEERNQLRHRVDRRADREHYRGRRRRDDSAYGGHGQGHVPDALRLCSHRDSCVPHRTKFHRLGDGGCQ
jgi:hypothetical protein